MKNLVIFGGSSHPKLVNDIAQRLGIRVGLCKLSKFSNKELNVEIGESVRGMDVYIIQSGCGVVNDNVMELLIMISACKTASARKVIAVVPCFPYSRQRTTLPTTEDIGEEQPKFVLENAFSSLESVVPLLSPLAHSPVERDSSFHSVTTITPSVETITLNDGHALSKTPFVSPGKPLFTSTTPSGLRDSPTKNASPINRVEYKGTARKLSSFSTSQTDMTVTALLTTSTKTPLVTANHAMEKLPYRSWTAQPGSLVARMIEAGMLDVLNSLKQAGAAHIITMDLHDPQFQGMFNVPCDNLLSQPLILRYIKEKIPHYKNAVIVSPDAGGTKRYFLITYVLTGSATHIADRLSMDFALIHKDRRSALTGSNLMLVGDVKNRVCILIDDIADTLSTLTRAAALLKENGATTIYGIITHGLFSGDALKKIEMSCLDSVIIGNSVPQEDNLAMCSKLKTFDVAPLFSEAIRRQYNGESVSALFDGACY